MTLVETAPVEAPVRKPRRRLGDRLLFIYTWLILLWRELFVGCSSNTWTRHPAPRTHHNRRWWPA